MLKNQHVKNSLTQKDKVKVSHAKINCIFSPNKNASKEPDYYPINLLFYVNENLVYF